MSRRELSDDEREKRKPPKPWLLLGAMQDRPDTPKPDRREQEFRPDGLGPAWVLSHRADRDVRPLADRHYNRRKVGSPQFVPPGRCVVLKTRCLRAFWVTSWQFAEYVKHAWAGAWVCSAFRSESAGVASDLIRQAVSCTRSIWDPPDLGMVTFIDRRHVTPTRVRGKDVWGWTWQKAGFSHCGETKKGLLAMQLLPANMPPPLDPLMPLLDFAS